MNADAAPVETEAAHEVLADSYQVATVAEFSHVAATQIYGARTVNRVRRTNQQLADVDEAIVAALELEHPATVRSVFYRAMSAGAVEKTENGYRLIARQLLKLRRDGRIPFDWVTDGTRYVLHRDTFTSMKSAVLQVARNYRRAIWDTQPVAVHMFTEKDALTGVISPITDTWDVPLGVMRGYPSESFIYEIATDLPHDKVTVMYQLGDHDPSGVDAWRSFADKVRGFTDAPVEFERLAVTPEQIVEMGLPTRPTKRTDSRARSFLGGSVEVDAISPSVLRDIVKNAIVKHLNVEALTAMREVEKRERTALFDLAFDLDLPEVTS